mmetsp:Transcript_14441/g.48347  ORF Transcript_14441/g.48347 Transcript_14441/m.48347 type:complete len:262 (-) Transcript_14441:797-1582(-)
MRLGGHGESSFRLRARSQGGVKINARAAASGAPTAESDARRSAGCRGGETMSISMQSSAVFFTRQASHAVLAPASAATSDCGGRRRGRASPERAKRCGMSKCEDESRPAGTRAPPPSRRASGATSSHTAKSTVRGDAAGVGASSSHRVKSTTSPSSSSPSSSTYVTVSAAFAGSSSEVSSQMSKSMSTTFEDSTADSTANSIVGHVRHVDSPSCTAKSTSSSSSSSPTARSTADAAFVAAKVSSITAESAGAAPSDSASES